MNPQPAELPTVYVVVTGRWGSDYGGTALTTERGLWSHISSSLDWLRHDLTDGFAHRKEQLAEMFPDGYNVVVVGEGDEPPEPIAHHFTVAGEPTP